VSSTNGNSPRVARQALTTSSSVNIKPPLYSAPNVDTGERRGSPEGPPSKLTSRQFDNTSVLSTVDGNAKCQPAINEPQLRQVIEEEFGGHRNRGTCQQRLRREHLCDYFGEVTVVSIAVVRVRQQVVGN